MCIRDRYRITTNTLGFSTGGTEALRLDGSQNATFAGTITANNKVTCDNGSGSGYLYADGGSTKVGSFSNHRLDFVVNNSQKAKLETNGNFTVTAGSVSDSKGDLRSIPLNTQANAYTLVASDAGKVVYTGGNFTINNNVFSAGDAITIINSSNGDITSAGTIDYLWNSADGTTGVRTLAKKGICTIYFQAHNTCFISGAGLS